MIVFNNYFKIVKQNLNSILLFVGISIFISIMNTSYSSENEFINSVLNVSIINYDNSILVDDFIEYMDENSNLIEINDTEKDFQDALYTQQVDVILIIKEGFTSELLNGSTPLIEMKKSGNSAYVEILVNKYFKLADTYSKINMSEDEIIKNIDENLSNEINVELDTSKDSNITKLALFYNFQAYSFLSIFLLVIGTIMCIFNKDTIKNRNSVSKLSKQSFSNQLFLGHLVMMLIMWITFILIALIIYKELMFNIYSVLLIINLLVFAFTATSLAYLISTFVKKDAVIEGIQSILPLTLCFLSGVFIPAEFLDPNIVNLSKIFPVYWFVSGNYAIVEIIDFNLDTLTPIILNYIIILSFGIFYLLLSKILHKK